MALWHRSISFWCKLLKQNLLDIIHVPYSTIKDSKRKKRKAKILREDYAFEYFKDEYICCFNQRRNVYKPPQRRDEKRGEARLRILDALIRLRSVVSKAPGLHGLHRCILQRDKLPPVADTWKTSIRSKIRNPLTLCLSRNERLNQKRNNNLYTIDRRISYYGSIYDSS